MNMRRGIPISASAAAILWLTSTCPAQTSTRIESEVVEFTNTAASPAHIARSKGPFFLVVVDRVTLPGHSLNIAPDVGSPQITNPSAALNADSLSQKKLSSARLDLPAGTYIIQSSAGSKPVCTLVIQ
jgi:hypothetical protein